MKRLFFLTAFFALALLAPGVCHADEIEILGTTGLTWQKSTVAVKPGDVVTWKIQGGKHGLMFNDFAAAQKVLRIEPGSLEIKQQPGFDLPAQGTVAKLGANTVLVKATVLDIPAGVTEVPFFCTQHSDHMIGKLTLQAAAPDPGH